MRLLYKMNRMNSRNDSVHRHEQSHCESSPDSFDKADSSPFARWPPSSITKIIVICEIFWCNFLTLHIRYGLINSLTVEIRLNVFKETDQ